MGIPTREHEVMSWLPLLLIAWLGMQDSGVKVNLPMRVNGHTIYDTHLQMKHARLSWLQLSTLTFTRHPDSGLSHQGGPGLFQLFQELSTRASVLVAGFQPGSNINFPVPLAIWTSTQPLEWQLVPADTSARRHKRKPLVATACGCSLAHAVKERS